MQLSKCTFVHSRSDFLLFLEQQKLALLNCQIFQTLSLAKRYSLMTVKVNTSIYPTSHTLLHYC